MNNLVCMEVSGKLKMQKMNGRTKVLILDQFPILQTIAYARAGCGRFTCKSLRLYNLPTAQTTPYAGAGSQCLCHIDARNHQQALELSTQGHVGTGGPPPPPSLDPRLLDCAIITTEQKRLQDQG
ncbi:hypothetical protein O181_064109 [Austropuccinia psidii MF-1]|uniref:Uncharacterized protein n=1 Tax=Austropuccinia psidii MF-1 TaxID=1389203 RepID=A0A9Q3I375_9BASI|nr:hypothetical protein [Austropuccinia psidii MF-1]